MISLRRRVGRFAGDRSGNQIVMYALVAPMLMTLVLGTFDIGMGMLALHTVERVARDGARFASIRGSESSSPATEEDIEAYVEGRAVGLDTDRIDVTVTWETPDHEPGERVTVLVSYDYNALLAGLLSSFEDLSRFERSATLTVMN